MEKSQKLALFLLRVVLGWFLFYAGITKLMDPSWSAGGYLKGAKLLQGFYGYLASPAVLPAVNFLNEWGLTLIGAALIIGAFTRLATLSGSLIMILYYLPILQFPHPDAHSYIVDQHIIIFAALLLLCAFRAGRAFGLGGYLASKANSAGVKNFVE